MLIEAFLSRVDDFCARSGRKEGGVATVLFGDGKGLRRLRSGKSCTVRALERAHARLDALVAELEATAAMRAEAGRLLRESAGDAGPEAGPEGSENDHHGNLRPAGADCDRNAAGELRRAGPLEGGAA